MFNPVQNLPSQTHSSYSSSSAGFRSPTSPGSPQPPVPSQSASSQKGVAHRLKDRSDNFYILDHLTGKRPLESLSAQEKRQAIDLKTWYFSGIHQSPSTLNRAVAQILLEAAPNIDRVTTDTLRRRLEGTAVKFTNSTLAHTLPSAKRAYNMITNKTPNPSRSPVGLEDYRYLELLTALIMQIPDPMQCEFADRKQYLYCLIEKLKDPSFVIPEELTQKYKREEYRFADCVAQYFVKNGIPITPFEKLMDLTQVNPANTASPQGDSGAAPARTHGAAPLLPERFDRTEPVKQGKQRKRLNNPEQGGYPTRSKSYMSGRASLSTHSIGQAGPGSSSPRSPSNDWIGEIDYSHYLKGIPPRPVTNEPPLTGQVSNGGRRVGLPAAPR